MFILDLQWFIFVLVLILLLALGLAPQVERQLWRRITGQPDLPGLGEMAPLLQQAPFGLMLLEGPHAYRYATPYGCHVLRLVSASGCLPEDA